MFNIKKLLVVLLCTASLFATASCGVRGKLQLPKELPPQHHNQ